MANQPDELLQTFLKGRDFDCPVCRYNLRDLQTDLCPECGTFLQLQVGAVDRNQNACIAGLVGLASGSGFSGLLLVYFVVLLIIDHHGSDIYKFIVVSAIPFVLLGSLLLLWSRNWRRIRRLKWQEKWALVCLCWLASLIDLIVFGWMAG